MKRELRLTKSAIRELKIQHERLKTKADDRFKQWSELNGRVKALETVLTSAGTKIVKESETTKPTEATPHGRVSALRQAITDILKTEGKAVKASALREKLTKRKVPFRTAYFWRVIGRMEGKGVIKRVGFGMYELANGAS